METLGCAKNRVDSEIMLSCLVDNHFSYETYPEKADVIIVNTCGFLESAVSESIERILALAQYRKSGKCKLLVAAGCMVERYKEALLEEIPELDAVLGTSDYTQIVDLVEHRLSNTTLISQLAKKPLYSTHNSEVKRILSTNHFAYLKIGEGCSNGCSFCNIPRLRGRQVSRSIENIKAEFDDLLDKGIKEVNLISQDCSSYGHDLKDGSNLNHLVKTLLSHVQKDFWLRLFYTYPNRYPTELLAVMSEDPRLVPYVDLPLQHINDMVLKAMNRNITRKELEGLINQLLENHPAAAIRSTFIVGFPNESEEAFNELFEFVSQGYFHHVGVFTYSHEDNIRSYSMGDQIPEVLKEERRRLIMEAQQQVSLEKNRAMVGQIQKVLIEGEYEETDLLLKGRNQYQGAEIDGLVLINEGEAKIGEFNQVEITEAHPYDLVGRIINP